MDKRKDKELRPGPDSRPPEGSPADRESARPPGGKGGAGQGNLAPEERYAGVGDERPQPGPDARHYEGGRNTGPDKPAAGEDPADSGGPHSHGLSGDASPEGDKKQGAGAGRGSFQGRYDPNGPPSGKAAEKRQGPHPKDKP